MSRRSNCPISNVLDAVGDKWSLLIIRDLMFFGKTSFSDLQNSDEKVATNILSSRLSKLEQDGLIDRYPDPNDKRKKVYALTDKGKDMLPMMLEMMIWSAKHDPNTNAIPDVVERAQHDRENLMHDFLLRISE